LQLLYNIAFSCTDTGPLSLFYTLLATLPEKCPSNICSTFYRFFFLNTAISSPVYKIKLSRRLISIKLSGASSRAKWLNDEQTSVSMTISVHVITEKEVVLETLVYSPFNHLKRLRPRETFN